jgi:3'(2'), 5'-bisphosphate nucleotidase
MDNISTLLQTAVDAALAGGSEILKVYQFEETVVELKTDNSPLTQADKNSHNAIIAILEDTAIPVLSEEGKSISYSTRRMWSRMWVVDPLDGTKEFIKRNGDFTVNIALVQAGVPILGVIYIPVTSELYFGCDEKGAYKVNLKEAAIAEDLSDLMKNGMRLPVNEKRNFTVVGSRSHMSAETTDYIQSLKLLYPELSFKSRGSSLKICMVAEGLADEYPRFAPTMEWDTAAGHALLRASGFEMFQYPEMTPLRYNKENLLNPWFIARRKD